MSKYCLTILEDTMPEVCRVFESADDDDALRDAENIICGSRKSGEIEYKVDRVSDDAETGFSILKPSQYKGFIMRRILTVS